MLRIMMLIDDESNQTLVHLLVAFIFSDKTGPTLRRVPPYPDCI